ncbi:MAG: 5-fold beta-flower protein [Bacteroidota bacterium]
MKKNTTAFIGTIAFIFFSTIASAQFKMDSDGRTLSNSSNSTVGKIDSDRRTISNAGGSTIGKIDSDGKTISNANGSTVLKISGNDINNASGSTVAKMSEVTNAINGSKPEAVYVALWWFFVKGN